MTATSQRTPVEDILAKAIASHDAGDLAAAEAGYREVLRLDEGRFEAHHLLGYLYLQAGQFDKAARCSESAILIRDDNPNTFLNLGMANRERGDIAQSIANIEHAARLNPDNHLVWAELGISQHLAGLNDDALDSYRTALTLAPEQATHHYGFGTLAMVKEDYPSAIAALEKAVAIAPDLADAHANLGLANMYLCRHKVALESFRTACRLDPLHRVANSNAIFVMTAMVDIPSREIFEHATAFGNRLKAKLAPPCEPRATGRSRP